MTKDIDALAKEIAERVAGLLAPADYWEPHIAAIIARHRGKDAERLRAWVERTATDKTLRTSKAGYHARRVSLEAEKLLAAIDEAMG